MKNLILTERSAEMIGGAAVSSCEMDNEDVWGDAVTIRSMKDYYSPLSISLAIPLPFYVLLAS
jgi:hypothetical protein